MQLIFLLSMIIGTSASWSADSVGLNVLYYEEFLRTGYELECQLDVDPGHKIRISRLPGADGKLAAQLTGELFPVPSLSGKILPRADVFTTFIELYTRNGDEGLYLEMLIERKADGKRRGYSGLALLTQAKYAKDEEGNEQEELNPGDKLSVRCLPL